MVYHIYIYHDIYHQNAAISHHFAIFITCDITFPMQSYNMVYHTHMNPYHTRYYKGVIYHFLGVISHIRTFQMEHLKIMLS